MGMLQYLRNSSFGCQRRPVVAAKAAANVCPISGQSSATGVCPISGQAAAATSSTSSISPRKAKAEPNVCPISGQSSATGVCPISGQAAAATSSAGSTWPSKAKAEPRQEESAQQVAQQEPADPAEKRDPPPEASSQADAEAAAELREKGNALFKKQEFEQALQVYQEALQLQPKDAAIWLNRSIVRRQLKQWAEGEQDAEVACELQPDNAKAHYSRALCLKEMGRLAEALHCCEKGLAAQPDNKALQQLQIAARRDLGRGGQKARKEAQAPPAEAKAAKPADENACPISRLAEESKAEAEAISGAYQWKDRMPSEEERRGLKTMMTDMFRAKYKELRDEASKATAAAPIEQYEKDQKMGLSLAGGHRPMKRPDHVDLPEAFRQPLGVISLEELGKYGIDNPDRRYLISVYGDCFDVSDRPDKYGPAGPYNSLTGRDITWGLAAGVDTPDYANKCYDLFKAKDMGKDKIAGVCSWLAWYYSEYGEPVAQLEQYTRESSLPAPPQEEMEEACCIM